MVSSDTGYPVSEEQGMEEESVGTQEEIVKHWAMMRETPLSAESDVRRGKGADKNQNQSRCLSLSLSLSLYCNPTFISAVYFSS